MALLGVHAVPVLCLLLGWLAQIWQASRELSVARGQRVWAWGFVAERPMRSGLSVFGAFGGYLLLIEFKMVSPAAAFGVGLLSDLILDAIRRVTAVRLGLGDTQEMQTTNLSETTVIKPKGDQ